MPPGDNPYVEKTGILFGEWGGVEMPSPVDPNIVSKIDLAHIISESVVEVLTRLQSQESLKWKAPDDIEKKVKSFIAEKEMTEKGKTNDLFDYASDDFDGLAALRSMTREMTEARIRTSILNQDTRNFIKELGLKLP